MSRGTYICSGRWSGRFVASISPYSFGCLIPWEPPEPPAASSVSNTPVCGTWSDPASNKLEVGHQMHWCGLGCVVFLFFFSIGDKWKEHCVTSACRIVRTVMLSVVGGVSLPWWCVFLKLLVLNARCGAHTQLAGYHLRYTARAAPRDWLCVWVPACLRFVTLLCHRLFPITNKGYGTELWSYVVPFDCCFATASWKLQ